MKHVYRLATGAAYLILMGLLVGLVWLIFSPGQELATRIVALVFLSYGVGVALDLY